MIFSLMIKCILRTTCAQGLLMYRAELATLLTVLSKQKEPVWQIK